MYKSLTEFIEKLESAGELIRIGTPVSSELEIAEITDRMVKTEGGGKALLFENTDKGFPVLTNLYGSERRMAMALGVEQLSDISERFDTLIGTVTSPKENFIDKLRLLPLLGEASKWFPRKKSSRGECQQVILMGEEANLSLLPILKCWPHDGGRFVTLPMVHTVDPERGIRNVGMYRMQVFDDHTTGMHWHRHKTGARHYELYKSRGERMPVSVAIGGDPVYAYSATAPVPDGIDEYLLAGLLRGKPVKLVKCVTNDIYVPEDCDFVIEGYVDPAEDKVLEDQTGTGQQILDLRGGLVGGTNYAEDILTLLAIAQERLHDIAAQVAFQNQAITGISAVFAKNAGSHSGSHGRTPDRRSFQGNIVAQLSSSLQDTFQLRQAFPTQQGEGRKTHTDSGHHTLQGIQQFPAELTITGGLTVFQQMGRHGGGVHGQVHHGRIFHFPNLGL